MVTLRLEKKKNGSKNVNSLSQIQWFMRANLVGNGAPRLAAALSISP